MRKGQYDIIIIGSGLSGLLSGYILAREGKKVCILEKNRVPGGCLQSFTRNGRIFDTGVHYFGAYDEGQPLNRYWKYFGLTGKLDVERMDPNGYDIISIAGKSFPLASGSENFTEQLRSSFPKEKNNLKHYVCSLEKISRTFPLYNLELTGDPDKESFRSQNAWEFFQSFASAGSLLPEVLSGNNFLYAGNKRKTPLYVAAIINHSFLSSSWRLMNGSDQIARELINSIRNFGGEVLMEKNVVSIEKETDGFRLETTTGESFTSGIVISAIHPTNTLKMMQNIPVRKVYSDRISSLPNTPSSFSLFIGMKPHSFPYLRHNVHHFINETSWIDEKADHLESFMLYTLPSADDTKWAKGAVIMTKMDFPAFSRWQNTTSGNRGADYESFKSAKAAELLDLVEAEYPEFRKNIEQMTIATPLTWRDYTGTPEGSMYGVERDCHDPMGTSISPVTKIPGLFFTGQSTNLHGVLGVTIGAVLTCGEIIGLEYLLNKIRNV